MSGERAWIEGQLRIRADVMAALEAEAVARYPSEACGFVLGPESDPSLLDEAVTEVNEADKYHRLDPETFPRTSATYFKLNELRAAKRFAEGEATGRPVKVIFHSHCDAGAYFSAEDAYTFASEGQLMWPCAFIVVSVVDGAVADRKLWVHVSGTNDFRESSLEVI
jgi:[CysO sulfur-carrier protein]-S-L-cysteine hydrolase